MFKFDLGSLDWLSEKENSVLNSLTGLRFLAALSIAFAHLTVPLGYEVLGIHIAFSSTSILGMSLFFVLSGFVIHYNYAKLFDTQPAIDAVREFTAARIARIYPLFLAVLAFHLWHDDMFMHLWKKADSTTLLAALYALNVFSWIPVWVDGKLLIQHNYGVAWSISTEWFFYFAYIFFARRLASFTTRASVRLFVSVIAIALAIHFFGITYPEFLDNLTPGVAGRSVDFLNSTYRWLFYVSPYSRVFEFLLGCVAAQIVMSSRRARWFSETTLQQLIYACGALIVALFASYVGFFSGHPSWMDAGSPAAVRYFGHLHMNFGFAPLFAALILLLAMRDLQTGSRSAFLATGQMVFLGEISYSLYLLHPIAMRIVPIAPDLPNLWFRVACGLFLVVALAIGTYTLIEKPGRKWVRIAFGRKYSPRA